MDINSDFRDVLIFDDILTDEESDRIYNNFLTKKVDWGFMSSTCTERVYDILEDTNTFESHQFVSLLSYEYGNYSNSWKDCEIDFLSHKISEKLGHKLFYKRIKANLLINQNTEKKYNLPHIDFSDEKHLVIIYYVNTSDAPTHLFKNDSVPWQVEQVIESKKGRFLVFPGNKYHAGMHPKLTPHRIVINFNVTHMEKIGN